MDVQIPLYRAKKLNSYGYAIGRLIELKKERFRDITKWVDSSSFTFAIKLCRSDIAIPIDPSTLSIHFPDMLASDSDRLLPNGEKDLRIFASLGKSGRGGDILFFESGLEEFVAEFTSRGFVLYEYLDNKTIKNKVWQQNVKWYNLKITGIQQ